MDFIEGLTNLSSVIAKRKDIIETEGGNEKCLRHAVYQPFGI